MAAARHETAIGVEKHMLSAWCMACGAAIARHEPLVVVDREGPESTTLALRARPPAVDAALYHPSCFERMTRERIDDGAQRAFREALCGIDGGEGSYAAITQAARLVGAGGHLTVLVVTSLRDETGQVSGAAEILDRAAALADEAGVSCTVEVDPARPVHEVVSAWGEGHDLLAIGAPPKSVLSALVFNSVAETATRSRSTPLLLARPPRAATDGENRVLVASDARPGSDELVAFADRVASDSGASLSLIHAEHWGSPARAARISRQVRGLRSRPIDEHRPIIEHGSAGEAIIAAAGRLEASLVVMSSRRRSGLAAVGSVSRRVVHHGACSVLLVPPEHLSGAANAPDMEEQAS
jgi:nucleotide-binding universal stress UspA family protein